MPAETPVATEESIAVEIYDAIYHLRGTDTAYLEHLAALVNAKMIAITAQGGTVDSLRVAVLASLNLADDLEVLRERYQTLAGSMTQSQTTVRSRSASLADMLDEVLNGEEDAYEVPLRRAG